MPEIKRRFWKRWDGSTKNKTLDCGECEFEIDFSKKEICCWGVSFKYLCETNKPRRCEYYKRTFHEENTENSRNYVMQAIENKWYEKEDKFIQGVLEF